MVAGDHKGRPYKNLETSALSLGERVSVDGVFASRRRKGEGSLQGEINVEEK